MGLFSFLRPKDPREESLIQLYTAMLTPMVGSSQAPTVARELLEQAKAKAREEGSLDSPGNAGDELLKKESSNPKTTAYLAKIRAEGVTDTDIRWLWNLPGVERNMLTEMSNFMRIGHFQSKVAAGLSDTEAAKNVRKWHATYGDPADTRHETGDNRPLPEELTDRVNRYVEKRSADLARFKEEIENAGSVNALIRREIRKGNV